MESVFLIAAFAHAALAAAMLSNPNAASTSTSNPVTHTIAVGKNGFTFTPDAITADPGDTVEFQFYPSNHSVIQAEYGYPCVPIELANPSQAGFHSGFKPINNISNNLPSFSILIGDTSPIFYYCGAPNSCIGNGMVGAINPNSTQTVEDQRATAEDSTFMLNPGEPWPSEETSTPFSTPSTSSTPSISSTSSVLSTPSTTTTVPHSSSTPAQPSSTAIPSAKQSDLSAGTIAGIVIGLLALTGACIALLVYFCRGRKKQDSASTDESKAKHISDPYASDPSALYEGLRKSVETPYAPQVATTAPSRPQLYRTPTEHRELQSLKPAAYPASERTESVYQSHSNISEFLASLSKPFNSSVLDGQEGKDYSEFDGSHQWKNDAKADTTDMI